MNLPNQDCNMAAPNAQAVSIEKVTFIFTGSGKCLRKTKIARVFFGVTTWFMIFSFCFNDCSLRLLASCIQFQASRCFRSFLLVNTLQIFERLPLLIKVSITDYFHISVL